MNKNWKNICDTKNFFLRMLAATTEDPEILEHLKKGFPHLFSKTDNEPPLLPLTVLQQECLSNSRKKFWGVDYAVLFQLERACKKFEIPFFWFPDVPWECPNIWKQLEGKRLEKGLTVILEETEMFVVQFCANPTYHDRGDGVINLPIELYVGMKITKSLALYPSQCIEVTLAPKKFINLEA